MKTLRVRVSESTHRWLSALAAANVENRAGVGSTAADLLAQAAFCFADYAGRRTGSWEAGVGGAMLISSGIQNPVSAKASDRCCAQDEAARGKRREEAMSTASLMKDAP